ncbi:preprotein translocase subunit YajC [Ligilactobacillus cholophilus]|uniref:preprotein translocase subunit YajC n=1 Tax=Ligilactobacillus cholophilus TaxID=3050131 RepID=UPI0025B17751|nr:preprotein translocase subunit YajC [Ligilactobacillus cholophilus]
MFMLGAAQSGGLFSIIMLVLMFAIMYFLLIRPQKKQQQQWQNMINNLKRGDHVITRGGLHGVIDEIDTANKTVTLNCDGIFLLFSLNAIGNVQKADVQSEVKEEKPAKKEETKEDATKAEESSKEEK